MQIFIHLYILSQSHLIISLSYIIQSLQQFLTKIQTQNHHTEMTTRRSTKSVHSLKSIKLSEEAVIRPISDILLHKDSMLILNNCSKNKTKNQNNMIYNKMLNGSSFRFQESLMRPSILFNNDDDQYYISNNNQKKLPIQHCQVKTSKQKRSQSTHRRRSSARKKNNIHLVDESQLFIGLDNRIKVQQPAKDKYISQSVRSKMREDENKDIKMIFPSLTITQNFYFQNSENQDTATQKDDQDCNLDKENTNIYALSSQKKEIILNDPFNSQIMLNNSFNSQQKYNHQSQIQQQYNPQALLNEPFASGLDINILQSTPSISQKSRYFSQTILQNQANPNAIIQLLLLPLKNQTKQVLQVIVIQSIIDKQFKLSIDINGVHHELLKANKILSLSQTIYEIYYGYENNKGQIQNKKIYKMISNFDRNQYNIFRVDPNQHNVRSIDGTIISNLNIYNQKRLTLYYYSSSHHHTLQPTTPIHQITPINQTNTNNIKHITTTNLKCVDRIRWMRQEGLRKSNKEMAFRGQNNELKLIIGKRCSKNYKLICGSGLSPLLYFALAIVNIQL